MPEMARRLVRLLELPPLRLQRIYELLDRHERCTFSFHSLRGAD